MTQLKNCVCVYVYIYKKVLNMCTYIKHIFGFPGGSDGRESVCNAGDLGLIPMSEKSPGEGNGNPL